MGEMNKEEEILRSDTAAVDAPFEWLTGFKSIRHLVTPSRIIFGSDTSTINAYYHSSQKSPIHLNALHVGCGTSTIGESLACLRERTPNGRLLQYGNVVNVDNDRCALKAMQNRWENRRQTHTEDKHGIMQWECLDFSSDESCRLALDGVNQQLMSAKNTDANNNQGGCFDLVLDKSTLDCLLCTESETIAQFLCEVYSALRVPTISSVCNQDDNSSEQSTIDQYNWGGVYVLITFHPPEFIEQLLQQLPGADWHIEQEIIQREMENVKENKHCIAKVEEVNSESVQDLHQPTPSSSSSTSPWSSGTFNPNDNYRKTLNVFTCRRQSSNCEQHENLLDKDLVQQHIELVCDEHYKTNNPMITTERKEQLRLAFLEAIKMKNDTRDTTTIELKQCYQMLFTDAEKEHLSYEYFIEDWEAYCRKCSTINRSGMTFDVALDFLNEMQ